MPGSCLLIVADAENLRHGGSVAIDGEVDGEVDGGTTVRLTRPAADTTT